MSSLTPKEFAYHAQKDLDRFCKTLFAVIRSARGMAHRKP